MSNTGSEEVKNQNIVSDGVQITEMPDPPQVGQVSGSTLDGVANSTRKQAGGPPSDLARSAPLPQIAIPGYEMIGVLGRGGMGVVYKARHISTNRTVAIKTIISGLSASSTDIQRFNREAQVLNRLRHPGIIRVLATGDVNGLPYYTMEYCEAGSLADRLRGRPFPHDKAAGILEHLARAMRVVHVLGIIHRDLKPANILMAPVALGKSVASGQPNPSSSQLLLVPKITDFGLAKLLDTSKGLTNSGDMLGTPLYMAPEQAAGRLKEIGPACDVYSLGVIFYQLLTGRLPFEASTLMELLQKVTTDAPLAPSQLVPGVPRNLEALCLNCLNKEPAQRYPSAYELADDLSRIRGNGPIGRSGRPRKSQQAGGRYKRFVLPAGIAICLAVLVIGLLRWPGHKPQGDDVVTVADQPARSPTDGTSAKLTVLNDANPLTPELLTLVTVEQRLNDIPLKDALEHLADKYKFTCLFDMESLRLDPALSDIFMDLPVSLPAMEDVPLGKVLQQLVGQLRGTISIRFYVQQGSIVISNVLAKEVALDRVMQGVPLREVIELIHKDCRISIQLSDELRKKHGGEKIWELPISLSPTQGPLRKLMDRIASQVDADYSVEDGEIVFAPAEPFRGLGGPPPDAKPSSPPK